MLRHWQKKSGAMLAKHKICLSLICNKYGISHMEWIQIFPQVSFLHQSFHIPLLCPVVNNHARYESFAAFVCMPFASRLLKTDSSQFHITSLEFAHSGWRYEEMWRKRLTEKKPLTSCEMLENAARLLSSCGRQQHKSRSLLSHTLTASERAVERNWVPPPLSKCRTPRGSMGAAEGRESPSGSKTNITPRAVKSRMIQLYEEKIRIQHLLKHNRIKRTNVQ